MSPLQVKLVGLEVADLRPGPNLVFSVCKTGLDCLDDARGDLVLHREDVDRLAVEPLGPDLVAARDLRELRGDTQPGPRRPHAALEDVAYGQRAGDRGQIAPRLLRTEGGRP